MANDKLTDRQQQILDYIRSYIEKQGYPPSIRDIGKKMKITSTQGVVDHLNAIEKKGYIKRGGKLSRGIVLFDSGTVRKVPIIGRIAAGAPILAEENIEEYIFLDPSIAPPQKSILLRVKGESMNGKEIHDGDIAIIKLQSVADNGDIIAARINDEATIKTFRKRGSEITLEPANPAFQPIRVTGE